MKIEHGDYVLATKYSDGDPKDPWCVGFYAGSKHHQDGRIRYFVVDAIGRSFRSEGFRRVKKISEPVGLFLLIHKDLIEQSVKSLYSYVHKLKRNATRQSKELNK